MTLTARDLTLAYDGRRVIEGLDVSVPPGEVTAVVGPNGCGKSTLLRGLARLLRPMAGSVALGNRDVWSLRPRQFARQVALLPQSPPLPEGITVVDLVGRGRHPHRGPLTRWRALTMLPRIATGTLPDDHPLIRQGRCREVRVRSERPLRVHVDGEFFCLGEDGVHEVTVELLPGALRVLSRP